MIKSPPATSTPNLSYIHLLKRFLTLWGILSYSFGLIRISSSNIRHLVMICFNMSAHSNRYQWEKHFQNKAITWLNHDQNCAEYLNLTT